MSEGGGGARFAQKALARRVAFEVGGIDDFERDSETQVGVVGLVGDSHRSPTEFPKAAILPPEYFVLLVSVGSRHGADNLNQMQRQPQPQPIADCGSRVSLGW
jgi:hypothetical protein